MVLAQLDSHKKMNLDTDLQPQKTNSKWIIDLDV